ncbi:hypothetical protein DPEC_G00094500 [Dallia pectoralis]|uniref:Uncharacterized protein n=1 Tax=Dallia pectoralis TaxID=75939 RepID=A0ACC2H1H0_DALPE|nr:hypothetical protein DPEC_G00094500 [Dallia pectoralis]
MRGFSSSWYTRYHHVNMEMDRTPCVVHTLQLVVHMLQKEATVKRVLDTAGSVNTLKPSRVTPHLCLQWFLPYLICCATLLTLQRALATETLPLLQRK